MRIHHLSCGTFCPRSSRLINGYGGLLAEAHLSCHCLLVELSNGLVLIDTGLGTAELEDPAARIGPTWTTLMRPRRDVEESALHQLQSLGYYHDDVTDIVVTHLDFDHAGGLPDFPEARVHVYGPELEAATHPRTALERFRYKPRHWAHAPSWVRYELTGERWFGFEGVRALGDDAAEILLIPLVGHTRGHCGVAVQTETGWLLHAGDAYFHHTEIERPGRHAPPGAKAYERIMQTDHDLRARNTTRLFDLQRQHGEDVTIICSHDPDEFPRAIARSRGTAVRWPAERR